MKLSLAEQFSPYPYGRYPDDGPYCGEIFRSEYLLPEFEKARKSEDVLEVSLSGVRIIGTSFLEEAFGGLVRELVKKGIGYDVIEKTVIITDESSQWDDFLWKTKTYMDDAAKSAVK